jgi:hypothetical protein
MLRKGVTSSTNNLISYCDWATRRTTLTITTKQWCLNIFPSSSALISSGIGRKKSEALPRDKEIKVNSNNLFPQVICTIFHKILCMNKRKETPTKFCLTDRLKINATLQDKTNKIRIGVQSIKMIVNHLTTSSQLNHHFPNNQCTI